MSLARDIAGDYFRRAGQPRDSHLDAVFAYERSVLRDMLSRLEIILDDEGVPPDTAVRVLRCLLYGSPSPADAELRIKQDIRLAEALSKIPPMPR